ncbi:MAG: glycosyltransferase family 2 protein [Streptosporangiaceae bacterium]
MTPVELCEPLPALEPATDPGAVGRARVVPRLHSVPVGQVDVDLPPEGVTPERLAEHVWAAAGDRISAHLRDDGLPVPDTLDPAGIAPACARQPRCVTRRRRVLSSAPAVSVVIATRDRTDSLLRCLRSLATLAYPRFDVVVVDSAPSNTDTLRALTRPDTGLAGLTVRYVRENRPGLALAHNRGLALATGAWVAFTDDDVVVDPHWLTAIAEAAATAPGVACVTGLILPAELETPAQVLLEEYGGFARGFTRRLYSLNGHRPEDPLFPFTTGRLGSGANMAFETTALRGLGGFDPATGAGTPARGGDDLSGFLRILLAGRTLAYQPAALVWHWHRREYTGLRRQAHGYGMGLGAYLTGAIADNPRLLPRMVRQTLPAARHFLDGGSAKNRGKSRDFPRELEVAERLGLARGPFAYAASRWRYRRPGVVG